MKNLLDIIAIISIIPAIIFLEKLRNMKIDEILIVVSILNFFIFASIFIITILYEDVFSIWIIIWISYLIASVIIYFARLKETSKDEKEKLKEYREEMRERKKGNDLPIIDIEFEERECK